jgi:organic hydroperoxide reductase OsmC/OhrA
MEKQHSYKATIKWTGNKGTGTDSYSSYERSHEIIIENKMDILGSSDPAFRGDKLKHNPEELFLSSIAS